MPSSRRSRPRARSQPRFGPPPLDHSPPRRSRSTVPDVSSSRAFKFLKIILQYCYPRSCGGKEEVSSGSTRLSLDGWKLLQRILNMLCEEDYDNFGKSERNWKLTYSATRRKLYYTMPNNITGPFLESFKESLYRQRIAISKDHLENDGDGIGFDLNKRLRMSSGPWPIRIGKTWEEVRLDIVGYLSGPGYYGYGSSFGVEVSFAGDYRILKKKVLDVMMKATKGPSTVILFRLGYDSADALEKAALDPDMVAALDKTADFSIFQLRVRVDANGQRRREIRCHASHEIFRKSDGSAAEGNLELTVGDLIGWGSRKITPDVVPSESLLERKFTFPFSKLCEWISEEEEAVIAGLIAEHQFGPFLPEPVYKTVIIYYSDDSDGCERLAQLRDGA